MLVVDELVVYPWLPRVADLHVVFDCCEQISLRVRKPADSIDIVVQTFELELRLKNGLRVRVANQLTDHLLVYQIKVIALFLPLLECTV